MEKDWGLGTDWKKKNAIKRAARLREKADDKIITKITQIRRRNNIAWMALLKLAFKARPKQAARIMTQITENDREVTRWMAKLGK